MASVQIYILRKRQYEFYMLLKLLNISSNILEIWTVMWLQEQFKSHITQYFSVVCKLDSK